MQETKFAAPSGNVPTIPRAGPAPRLRTPSSSAISDRFSYYGGLNGGYSGCGWNAGARLERLPGVRECIGLATGRKDSRRRSVPPLRRAVTHESGAAGRAESFRAKGRNACEWRHSLELGDSSEQTDMENRKERGSSSLEYGEGKCECRSCSGGGHRESGGEVLQSHSGRVIAGLTDFSFARTSRPFWLTTDCSDRNFLLHSTALTRNQLILLSSGTRWTKCPVAPIAPSSRSAQEPSIPRRRCNIKR